jgi:signal transduction histidine kinase
MISAPLPSNEQERLSQINSYDILDTLPESDFDQITKIASQVCHTPISLISIVDSNRQWFKSRQGLSVQQTHRDLAFCSHAILTPNDIFVVPDSLKDERFFDNPLATGDPHVVFYAGVPLVNDGGYPFGTLCVIDSQPKDLDESQRETLKALAKQVVCLLELRRKNMELLRSQNALSEINTELENFAHVVAHDLKSPCNNLIMLSELLTEKYTGTIDEEGIQMLDYMKEASHTLRSLIDDILQFSKDTYIAADKRETFFFKELMEEVKQLLQLPANFHFSYTDDDSKLYANKTALKQVILNLCTNAIKYNDKEEGWTDISFMQDNGRYYFMVEDNGKGIPQNSFKSIFQLFHTLGQKDRFSQTGHGIGLSTVKKLVERLGGEIKVDSELGKGSAFSFYITK